MLPDKYTIEEKMIATGDGHQLYAQLWGNKDAQETIVFLHGGPGSGCSDKSKNLFDPKRHKVIFFDQRGSGKSLPYGSLDENNTEKMVEDINIVTNKLGASKFSLVGGSWGSCLALVYAIKHPNKVERMVLRGIFTGRKKEINFLDEGEFRAFFPEVWEKFANSAPPKFREHPGMYHLARVLGDDVVAAKESAYAYAQLEVSLMSLDDRVNVEDFSVFDPASTIVECHYLANNCFLEDNFVLNNASKLNMPIDLVQGRYDAVCPPFTAYELSKVLPNCTLTWTVSGHSGGDRGNWQTVKALLLR